MAVIGIRCSSKEFAYAIMDGNKAAPAVVKVATILFPQGPADPASLHWLKQEIQGICESHKPIVVLVIKRFEGQKKDAVYETRLMREGVIILATFECGVRRSLRKVNSTIAKDLGTKGKAKYLQTLDTSAVAGFAQYSDKEKEAILAAWSSLS